MEFNSLPFLIFFPVVTLLYFGMPKFLKRPWLLCCSYYFYMCWNAAYSLLLLFSTASTWACGWLIEKSRSKNGRRAALIVNLGVNLGILFFFKYFNFFSESFSGLLTQFGLSITPLTLDTHIFLLPVGISFYTFQALGYSIDVYRGVIPHERSFLNYALFVSFFPQLVAGPIERAAHFLPQLKQDHIFEYKRVSAGLKLMLWGFFQKVVIADGLAVMADKVFDAPTLATGQQAVLGILFFTIQIYCDFGGYSNIAIGAAQVLGFDLMTNFAQPYFSASVREFWRRWHISLSSWLKDYIYFPLGGSRCSTLRRCFNLMLTFLASGLWHGAKWTFVIWGALHGALCCLEAVAAKPAALISKKLRLAKLRFLTRPVRVLLTFFTVSFIWVFFRAETLADAGTLCGSVFGLFSNGLFDGAAWMSALEGVGFFRTASASSPLLAQLACGTGVSLLACTGLLAVGDLCEICTRQTLHTTVQKLWFPARWAYCVLITGCILLFGHFGVSSFVYFQF